MEEDRMKNAAMAAGIEKAESRPMSMRCKLLKLADPSTKARAKHKSGQLQATV